MTNPHTSYPPVLAWLPPQSPTFVPKRLFKTQSSVPYGTLGKEEISMAEQVRDGRYVAAGDVKVIYVTGGSEFDKLLNRYVATGYLTVFRDAGGNVVKPGWPVEHFGQKIAELIKKQINPTIFYVYQTNDATKTV